METPKKIKRDMAKCAKRVSEVIECFCEAGELVGCAQDARYELIGGISCIRQLEQEIKQKDERIQQLEREKEAFVEYARGLCRACKHFKARIEEEPCLSCKDNSVFYCPGPKDNWEWRGVEEEKHE